MKKPPILKRSLASLALFALCLSTALSAKSPDATLIGRCSVSGLGATDVNFTEDFSVYASNGKPNSGYVKLSSVLVQHIGKPVIERTKKELPVKIRQVVGSASKLRVEFAPGTFSEDYLAFEMPKKPENLSQTFELTWGGHRYFCRMWE